jgi:hypothetical protein
MPEDFVLSPSKQQEQQQQSHIAFKGLPSIKKSTTMPDNHINYEKGAFADTAADAASAYKSLDRGLDSQSPTAGKPLERKLSTRLLRASSALFGGSGRRGTLLKKMKGEENLNATTTNEKEDGKGEMRMMMMMMTEKDGTGISQHQHHMQEHDQEQQQLKSSSSTTALPTGVEQRQSVVPSGLYDTWARVFSTNFHLSLFPLYSLCIMYHHHQSSSSPTIWTAFLYAVFSCMGAS